MDAAQIAGSEGTDDALELSTRDREILAFERQWWKYAGAKEQAVRELFDMSATRYYQVLNTLIDSPAALAVRPDAGQAAASDAGHPAARPLGAAPRDPALRLGPLGRRVSLPGVSSSRPASRVSPGPAPTGPARPTPRVPARTAPAARCGTTPSRRHRRAGPRRGGHRHLHAEGQRPRGHQHRDEQHGPGRRPQRPGGGPDRLGHQERRRPRRARRATTSPTVAVVIHSTKISVFNATSRSGLAKGATSKLSDAGWTTPRRAATRPATPARPRSSTRSPRSRRRPRRWPRTSAVTRPPRARRTAPPA